MIFIIGTDPYFQVSTTPKRAGGGKAGLIKFQRYLSATAKRLAAAMIAEEASEEWVSEQGSGAWSVPLRVAQQLGIRHRFCDPDTSERHVLGLRSTGELWDKANTISMRTGRDIVAIWREEVSDSLHAREDFWINRIKVRGYRKMTIIYVPAAFHVETFKATLVANGIDACIHCRDWPNEKGSD
jgi:hypothetical protein